MTLQEKMKRDWNRRARHHARFWIATEDYQTEEIFAQSGQATAQALLTKLRGIYHHSWRVLDVGCGIGRVLKPLSPYFHELVGVDVSAKMIAQSKIWLSEHSHIATHETSGMDLKNFPDNHFDLVYSYVTFQHMPRSVFEGYLGEINRVLKAQGYFIFQLPLGSYMDNPPEDTIGIRSYPSSELRQKLTQNGFDTHLEPRLRCSNSEPGHSHDFLMTRKEQTSHPSSICRPLQLHCLELEKGSNQFSPLDLQLYEQFAERRFSEGYSHEAITTLQDLVDHNPQYLSGWLQLATLLVETGQIDRALATLRALTTLHPRYQKAHDTLQTLLKNHAGPDVPLLKSSKAEGVKEPQD